MPDSYRLDPQALAVLAHPLRARMLAALRVDGPATATDLADRFETNTGATSYHLRKLASVGLVDDNGSGTGRRRVWQATATYTLTTPATSPATRRARRPSAGWSATTSTCWSAWSRSWQESRPSWPTVWQDAAGMSDDVVTVTPEQMKALAAELWEVVVRYRAAGADHPGARRVAVHVLATPLEAEGRPRRGDGRGDPMTDHLSPAAARRAFLLLTATRWFPLGLVVGILMLLPLERGLTAGQTVTALGLMGLVVFALELPTSGFADAFGRRPVLVAAGLVNLASARRAAARRVLLGVRASPRC